MTEDTKKYDRLSRFELYSVMKLIEENGIAIGENGTSLADKWKYNSNWSDAKVAETLGLNPTAVANCRRECFGRLYYPEKAPKVTKASDLEAQFGKRIDALERAVNLLLTAPSKPAVSSEKLSELRHHFNHHRPNGE